MSQREAVEFSSHDPATGQVVWQGKSTSRQELDQAVTAAREALEAWSSRSLDDRVALARAYAERLKAHRQELAEAISREMGKPLWESLGEVDSMIGKVPISIQAQHERRSEQKLDFPDATGMTRYKPHGVAAVFGPFNFPGHLPNGHIVPALLAGNTIVFKPSEMTPGVGQRMVELWREAGLPQHVLNLVQGGRDLGEALAAHAGIDALFFTGSCAAGVSLSQAWAKQPGKVLALEMGGNNPLVVWEAANVDAAAYLTIQSAFITSGQRCSCARRLIIPTGADGQRLIDRLTAMMKGIRVGAFTDRPEPFMGPLISPGAAERLLLAQEGLAQRGGVSILSMRRLERSAAMLSPGLMDVTNVPNRPDEEYFGPFLQVIRVKDFDAAIAEANNTAFGLCAALLSDSRGLYETFFKHIRAGVVNWNRPTTGASSKLPFGGIGQSGNHRPSGAWAADYCSYPVASLESQALAMPPKPLTGIEL